MNNRRNFIFMKRISIYLYLGSCKLIANFNVIVCVMINGFMKVVEDYDFHFH